ncbi:MAG: TIGR01777 family protein [Methylotenera sp.]|nr:TIGR01777 family protein [Oligoflexia bacterium]
MKVLVTGATGFVGKALVRKLIEQGQEVTVLSRDAGSAAEKLGVPCLTFSWDASREPAPEKAFEGIEAVIHLAGEPVAATRWNDEVKKRIMDSRTLGTRNLVTTLNHLAVRPRILISASAIGFYGSRGDEVLDESSAPGQGFLAQVCQAWESEAHEANVDRKVIVRIGVVLGKNGGALEKMLPPFKAGLGGPIGSGKHWMSWIHLDDLIGVFLLALQDPRLTGIVNAVSPQPVSNLDFTHALGHALHRPSFVKVPPFALRLAFGEMADEALLASARVTPGALLRDAFPFRHPDLNEALASSV